MTSIHDLLHFPIMKTSCHSCLPRSGVLAIVRRQNNFLLVRRAKAPDAGLWGFPGGRIEPGETIFYAAERELLEETSLSAKATSVIDAFDSLHYDAHGKLEFHYIILAVRCEEQEHPHNPVQAGDDALEARWFSYQEISTLGERASARLHSLARQILKMEDPTYLT
ncbi:NUDIX hydrolase [Acetobacter sp. AAB5]|uniref:NUDIX hydrolase n=1 Tax=Acetobacter sp. AAB5 TaxID=3418370 RepID=UPI003CF31A85